MPNTQIHTQPTSLNAEGSIPRHLPAGKITAAAVTDYTIDEFAKVFKGNIQCLQATN